MDQDMELVDRVMNALFNADEWQSITVKDPKINTWTARVGKIMDRLESIIPYELYSELEDAIGHVETAYSDAGILFGMHVAETLQRAAANPAVYSAYAVKMMLQREATA